MATLLLAGFLTLLIGGALGLLGGGGGVLAVPLLVYVVGVGAKPAIAMSLFLVGTTSLVGAALQARAGRVRFKLGASLGVASMAGAFVAGRLAEFVPEPVLLVGLGAVMLFTALAMLRRRSESAASARPLATLRALALGAGVGVVSGFVGAGGGFLLVPALTIFAGLAMHEAIATSLFVIALQSFAGFAGHFGHVTLDWPLVAVITSTAIAGMLGGSVLGKRCSARGLRLGFAGLVITTALFVLGRQLPPVWTALVAVVALALAFFLVRRQAVAAPVQPLETKCITSPHLQP